MKSGIALTQPYQKRLSQSVEYRYEITNYGADNLYPQKVKSIVIGSPIAHSATKAMSSFLRGDGWEQNGEMVVNDNGETLNFLLRQAALSHSFYNSFTVHVNVNSMGGITDMRVVPFDFVRFGLPNSSGKYKDVKISANWAGSQYTLARKILTYTLWGNEPVKDSEEGFIFYVIPENNVYPLSVADSVLDSCQTDAEIQVFELGGIQNGFLGTSIFRHPGKITDPIERKAVIDMLRQLKGSTGANGIGYLETPPNFDGPLIENIPANNQDSLFEKTNKNVISRVLTTYTMPPAIVGIQPESGMFNQQQLEDSYVYYNLMTKDRRNILAEQFNYILSFWHTGAIDVGEIIENTFTIDGKATDHDSETE